MLHSFTTNWVEARKRNVRGTALDSLLKYADRISYAHKGNVDKHVKSVSLHDWAKEKFQGSVTEQPQNFPVVEKNQRTLQDTIQAPSNIANYRRLFVTALHIAMKEKPISDFEDLIELQQNNGLKFLQGKSHEKSWAEFIAVLADTLKKAIKMILLQVSAFSLAFDGSQPRKTGTEKKLLYSKCAILGEAVELLLECIHVDDYGSDPCDLKRTIDDVILTRITFLKNVTSNCWYVFAQMGRVSTWENTEVIHKFIIRPNLICLTSGCY